MRARKVPNVLPFGTVSHGTMREEDLIPAFLDASDARSLKMSRADRAKWYQLKAEWETIPDTGDTPSNVAAEHGDTLCELLTDLCDLLCNYAPPYAYFGSHPGDGSDYGVWLSEDVQQDVRDNGGIVTSDNGSRDTGDTIPPAYSGERLDINDHGNATLYHYTRGRARVIWSIV